MGAEEGALLLVWWFRKAIRPKPKGLEFSCKKKEAETLSGRDQEYIQKL